MGATKLAGMVLLIVGILAVIYGGFSYTRETAELKVGPVELSVRERETVNIPLWAGIGAIVAGGVLLLVGGRKP